MKKQSLEHGAARGAAQVGGVLLHGRGGIPDDMVEVAGRLAIPAVRWVAPAADGRAWYPERFMEPLEVNEPFLTEAVLRCEQAMVDATEHGRIGVDRSLVVGFSQGACLATEFLLRHPGRCRAAVLFTGGLIGPPGTLWRTARASLDGLHVFMTGSDIDEWVPFARVRETADVLRDLGATVELRLYTGRPHIISDREIGEARTFLEHVAELHT